MMWFVTNAELLAELQTIRRLLFLHTKPGAIHTRLTGERRKQNMDILSYEVTLPAVPAGASVETQRLDVTIGGVTASQEPALDVVTVAIEAPQDSAVALALVYIDEAGNASQASTREFVAVDTIAPAQPGEMTVVATGERRTE
jgi:hypothetical protein